MLRSAPSSLSAQLLPSSISPSSRYLALITLIVSLVGLCAVALIVPVLIIQLTTNTSSSTIPTNVFTGVTPTQIRQWNKPDSSQRTLNVPRTIEPPVTPTPTPKAVSNEETSIWTERAQAVKDAFLHAYTPYEEHCFGHDEYHPLSRSCTNWIGAGLTIIDALPTMHVMGLTDQFQRGVDWVKSSMSFNSDSSTSFFETTIRVLGGLISVYDLTGDKALLDKAVTLGDRLMPVFNTPTGIPLATINLRSGNAQPLSWTGGSSLLAELGTCQMEFFALSERSGNKKYHVAAQKPIDLIDNTHPTIPGLYPIYISPQSGQFTNSRIAWGAMGDSFYEYLLKVYILTGKKNIQYLKMYKQSIDSMLTHLYKKTPNGYAYIADMDGGRLDHKMDHLVCFVPGMLALGVLHKVVTGVEAERHMSAAKELMRTCVYTYTSQPSGIGAEYSIFNPEPQPGHDSSYKLRPETMESLFILFRVTLDPQYREQGWLLFSNIIKHCKVEKGFAALLTVTNPERKEDKMESFFLAETLKYIYLLFSDTSLIPLAPSTEGGTDFFVFNTECHPIRPWNT